MPIGRPRTVSLSPEEMIKLGEEMILWVKKNDPLHLSEFYCIEKDYTDKEWETMHVAPEFFPYYEKALKIIGRKYLDKNSNVRNGVAERWLRVYFKDLKKQEDSDKDENAIREAQAKADANNPTPPQDDPLEKDNKIMRLEALLAEAKVNNASN